MKSILIKIISFAASFFLNIYLARELSLKNFGIYINIQLLLTFSCAIFSLNIPEYITSSKQIDFHRKKNITLLTILTFMSVFLLSYSSLYIYNESNLNLPYDNYFLFFTLLILSIIFIISQRLSMIFSWYNLILIAELFNNSMWGVIFITGLIDISIDNLIISRIFSISIFLSIFAYCFLTKEKKTDSIQHIYSTSSKVKLIVTFGITSLFGSLSYILLSMADRFYAAIYLNDSSVSLLAVSQMPIYVISGFVNSILLIRFISLLLTTNNENEINSLVINSISSLISLSIITMLLLSFFSNEIIMILGGSKYTDSIPLLRIYSLNILPVILLPFLKQYIITISVKIISITYTIALIFGFSLGYIFIETYGLLAIPIISVVTNYILLAFLLFYALKKNALKYIVFSLPLYFTIVLTSFFISEYNLITKLVISTIFIFIYTLKNKEKIKFLYGIIK